MDSKNKFWRGVMVGVLVTALVCLITRSVLRRGFTCLDAV